MTEVEFLPTWYTNSKRRQFGYRTQYVALIGVLAVMVVWNFSAARSISLAKAEMNDLSVAENSARAVTAKVAATKTQLAALKTQAQALQKIDSRIDVPAVLGEISFLIDRGIVMKQLELIAEKFQSELPTIPNAPTSPVRVARPATYDKGDLVPIGDVRFRLVISGLASDASDVASLIVKLEDSPYFNQVVPSFSRTVLVGAQGTVEDRSNSRGKPTPSDAIPVSEFEITCYLANYQDK